METTTYSRKPLLVEAVQMTDDNALAIAQWCGGSVYVAVNGKTTIHVKVLHPLHSKQEKAQPGDWILKSTQGYKIYQDSAFKKGFELVEKDTAELTNMGELLREKLATVNATEALQFRTPAPAEEV